MCKRKSWLLNLFLVLCLILMGWVGKAQSQEKYPTRAIDIIVPYGPGGGTDLPMRLIASYLNKKWGVPVNVVNKPGGETIPACLEVYSAKPDGYTLLADGLPSSSALPLFVKDLPFKVMDRSFIAMATTASNIMMVAPSSPIKTLKDLEVMVKKDPGNFTWSAGSGPGPTYLNTIQFLRVIGVDPSRTKIVVSKGSAETVQHTGGGHVVLGLSTVGSVVPAIKGGLVRGLAIVSNERWPDLPDLPTTVEQGYPSVNIQEWKGVSGPPKLPTYIVEAWNKAMQELVKDPEFISKLRNIGQTLFYHNAEEFREYVIKETEEIKKLWGMK